MKFFIDTAKVEDIKKANDMGVICGVTTNPSLIAKEGRKFEEVIKEIVPWLDVVMMDIKHIDPEVHKEYTGVSNEQILKNALLISSLAKKMIIRVPVIPGFNASPNVIAAIAKFTTYLHNVNELHLLPYHDLGSNKYGMLGKEYELADVQKPENEFMEELKAIVEKEGLTCKIGG